ncbi:uncharacterized secreted YBBR-like protein [Crocosphaera watsonii WH 0003]|uniref:Uncharacterized secreted YBBR-like protein n=1 Tax=Crocosphaera watsonii WH 0003 TaxID=423471 RepID=G5JE48_CROWT|nr:uncharacterized secreted YBBR-like protein [Crocosphaera watsonii WH 0003]
MRTNSVGGFDAQTSFDSESPSSEELKGNELHPVIKNIVNKINLCFTWLIINVYFLEGASGNFLAQLLTKKPSAFCPLLYIVILSESYV